MVLVFDISLEAQNYRYLHKISFEEASSLIYFPVGKENIWQIGKPSKIIFNQAYSEPKAIVTDTLQYYPVNNVSSFILKLPQQSFLDQTYTEIVLLHKYDMDSLTDYGIIDVSYDEGRSWCPVSTDNTYEIDYWRRIGSSITHNNIITGSLRDAWAKENIVFIWYYPVEGCNYEYPDFLWLRFRFVSDEIQQNKEGWLIDDISIEGSVISGLQEEASLSFEVSPNPCSNFLKIRPSFESGKELTVYMYDILGKLVLYNKYPATNISVKTEKLENGIYFYIILDRESKAIGQGKVLVRH